MEILVYIFPYIELVVKTKGGLKRKKQKNNPGLEKNESDK